MKITLNEKELDLHYSYRIHIMFEEVLERPVDFGKMTMSDIEKLFFFTIISTLKYNKIDYDLTFEDFRNWVDDNGNDQLLLDYFNWLVKDVMKVQEDLIKPLTEEQKEEMTENADENF